MRNWKQYPNRWNRMLCWLQSYETKISHSLLFFIAPVEIVAFKKDYDAKSISNKPAQRYHD